MHVNIMMTIIKLPFLPFSIAHEKLLYPPVHLCIIQDIELLLSYKYDNLS